MVILLAVKSNRKTLSGLELPFMCGALLYFFPLGFPIQSQGEMAMSTVSLLAVVASVDLVYSVHLLQRHQVD
jgi:hypothetical protein